MDEVAGVDGVGGDHGRPSARNVGEREAVYFAVMSTHSSGRGKRNLYANVCTRTRVYRQETELRTERDHREDVNLV